MTENEVRRAIKNKKPIMLKVITLGWIYYECILQISEYQRCGERQIKVLLKDRCGHSVTTADPKMLRYAADNEILNAKLSISQRCNTHPKNYNQIKEFKL